MRAVATATFHAPKLGLLRRARQGPRRARVRRVEIGIPRGAPGAGRAGLICERVLELYPRRDAQRIEVHLGRGRGRRRLAGAHRRAHDGRSLGRARRRGLRPGGRARPGAAGGGPAPARADEPRAARRRRLPHAGRRGRGRGDGGAGRRRGARPGLGRDEGALEFARGVARSRAGAAARGRRRAERARGPARAVSRARRLRPCSRPHEGELGRLLERDSAGRVAHRLACAREAARAQRRRGAARRATTPSSRCRAARSRSARAARPRWPPPGTGDVLSGLIGALLAKGLGPVRGRLPRHARPRAGGRAVGGEPSRAPTT